MTRHAARTGNQIPTRNYVPVIGASRQSALSREQQEQVSRRYQQWLNSAIKMMMGIGTPSRKSKIERIVKPPQHSFDAVQIRRREPKNR
jgi:hypothetical protein